MYFHTALTCIFYYKNNFLWENAENQSGEEIINAKDAFDPDGVRRNERT